MLKIDDFVGAGETAEKALKCLIGSGIDKSKIVVLAFVASKRAVKKSNRIKSKVIFQLYVKRA